MAFSTRHCSRVTALHHYAIRAVGSPGDELGTALSTVGDTRVTLDEQERKRIKAAGCRPRGVGTRVQL